MRNLLLAAALATATGAGASRFFQPLAKAAGQAPQWNFHKYPIDRDGRVVASYSSTVEPGDPKLIARIEQLLAAKP